MSSLVDFDTNAASVQLAVNNVVDPKHASCWCILGFDKTKRTIKLVDQGDDDEDEESQLDELESAFNDSKIQFGFASVTDPNTGLKKIVYVRWCGDATMPMDKPRFPQQADAVGHKFPNAHIVIDARDSRDVKIADIKAKIAKSSGSNYSIHKEKANPAAFVPEKIHGSGYQKADVIQGNASSFKSRFEPGAQSMYQEESNKRIEAERAARRKHEDEQRQTQQQHEQQQQQRNPIQRRPSEEARAAPRPGFNDGGALGLPPPRAGGVVMPPRGGFPKAEVVPVPAPPTPVYDEAVQQQEAEEHYDEVQQQQHYDEPQQQEHYDEVQQQQNYDEPQQQQHYDEPQQQQHYDEVQQQQHYDEPQQQQNYDEVQQEQHYDQEQETAGQHGEWGICATTLYDYQANEEGEIGFDVNQVITNIDKVDEGWWLGTNEAGERGLFPSNYTEEMKPQ